jgi:chaperonin GroEL
MTKRSFKNVSEDLPVNKFINPIGGVAVLKVGGASEVEVGELKDRINDALCATKAAAEEGIVPGGGTALLYASRVLENLKGENFDQQNGIDIVKQSIRRPLMTIMNNAGLSGNCLCLMFRRINCLSIIRTT